MDSVKQWFKTYVASFTSDNPVYSSAYALKYDHSFKVMDEALAIASAMDLDDDLKSIIAAAAILHDTARFEQYRDYGTFVDGRSFNHGKRGAEIIIEAGILSSLIKMDSDAVIDAVRYHNGFQVPKGLPYTNTLLVKMVRDADKLDIFRIASAFYTSTERNPAVELELPDSPDISPEICANILAGTMGRMSDLKSLNDFKLLQMAWVYDINFTPTLRMLDERKFLPTIRASLPDVKIVDDVYQTVSEFMKRRVNQEV